LKFQAIAEKTAKIEGGYFLPHPVCYTDSNLKHVQKNKKLSEQTNTINNINTY